MALPAAFVLVLVLVAATAHVLLRRSARVGWQTELAGIRREVLFMPAVHDMAAIDAAGRRKAPAESVDPMAVHQIWAASAEAAAGGSPSPTRPDDDIGHADEPAQMPPVSFDEEDLADPRRVLHAPVTPSLVEAEVTHVPEAPAPAPVEHVADEAVAHAAAGGDRMVDAADIGPSPVLQFLAVHRTAVEIDGSLVHEIDLPHGGLRVAGAVPRLTAFSSGQIHELRAGVGRGWAWHRGGPLEIDADRLSAATVGPVDRIVVDAPGAMVRASSASTFLVVVDDAGTFVVSLDETVTVDVGGARPTRVTLRCGGMALVPADGSEPTLDAAAPDELADDGLVADNRRRDRAEAA